LHQIIARAEIYGPGARQRQQSKETAVDTLIKSVQKALQWFFSPAKTIAGAIAWSLATAATTFIAAVSIVFVRSVRPDSSITELVRQAEYAVAVVLAVFIPIIALMGAIFLVCLIGRSLYRLFKGGKHRQTTSKKPTTDTKKSAVVIPFNDHKRASAS
jgi:membrane glycosyltransferase